MTTPRLYLNIAIVTLCLATLTGCYKTLVENRTLHGKDLSGRITGGRLRVAVLPAVDWSHFDTHSGDRDTAFQDIEVLVTNEMTRMLWQKNRMFVVKKGAIQAAMVEATITKEELFPMPNQGWSWPKQFSSLKRIGLSQPNFDKLYSIGRRVGADLLFLNRITRNCQDEPFAIVKVKYNDVIIDLMVLDVASQGIIAFGYYGARLPENGEHSLADAASTILYYAPLPDSAFMAQKNRSELVNAFFNAALQGLTDDNLEIGGSMDFMDETWRMYPPDYFEQNYMVNRSDYDRMFAISRPGT